MAKRIEQAASGAEVYQVTDDPRPKSDIYCELPYCSPDMKWMVFNSDRTGRTEIHAARIPDPVPAKVLAD